MLEPDNKAMLDAQGYLSRSVYTVDRRLRGRDFEEHVED
jgi:hypothetical protein